VPRPCLPVPAVDGTLTCFFPLWSTADCRSYVDAWTSIGIDSCAPILTGKVMSLLGSPFCALLIVVGSCFVTP
jgi:hypothetical protein